MENDEIRTKYEKEAGHPYVREHYTETAEELPWYAKMGFFLGGVLLTILLISPHFL